MPNAATRFAVWDYRLVDRVHPAVCRRGRRTVGHVEVHELRFRRSGRSSRGLCPEGAGCAPLLPIDNCGGCVNGDDFFPAGISVWTGAHLVRDVAGWVVAEAILCGASQIQNAALVHVDCLLCSGDSGRDGGYRRRRRSFQHWYPVCLHSSVAGGHLPATAATRSPANLSRALRAMVPVDFSRALRRADDGVDCDYMDPLRGLVSYRLDDLFLL